jgi:hypothetical protein
MRTFTRGGDNEHGQIARAPYLSRLGGFALHQRLGEPTLERYRRAVLLHSRTD